MTILSSLKKLHKKMTGEETTSKTIGGILDSMQENYSSSGGSDLPEPKTAGNVLTSTGTGWESAAPQGGDNDFVVEFNFAEDEVTGDITISTETAISAILAALAAGKNVKGFSDDDNGYNEYYLNSAIDENLQFIQPGYNAVQITGYTNNGDDVWAWSFQMPMIPLADDNDEGKILCVDDKGDYALVNPKYLVATADVDPSTGDVSHASHTLAEVVAASNAGKAIIFRVHAQAVSGNDTINHYETFATSEIYDYGSSYEAAFYSLSYDTATNVSSIHMIFAASGDQDGAWLTREVPLTTGQ